MQKRYKIGLIIIVILIIALGGLGLFKYYKKEPNTIKNTTSIIKDIKEYAVVFYEKKCIVR